VPDALIGVPNSWTPDQIRQFQDYWDTEFAGDLARRRRAKFVPGDTASRVHQTKEPEQKNEFDEWLARIRLKSRPASSPTPRATSNSFSCYRQLEGGMRRRLCLPGPAIEGTKDGLPLLRDTEYQFTRAGSAAHAFAGASEGIVLQSQYAGFIVIDVPAKTGCRIFL